MANRADELRSMMKFKKHQTSATGASALNGKDKAKLLKMAKDKQKQASSASAAVATSVATGSKKHARDAQEPTSSALPNGFFDDDGDTSMVNSNSKRQKTADGMVVSGSVMAVSSGSGGSLPTGFFDETPQVAVTVTETKETKVANWSKEADIVASNAMNAVSGANYVNMNQSAESRKELASTKMTNKIMEKIGKSDLPAGFFDDVEGDLEARGVTMKQFEKLRDQQAQEELDVLMGEISAIHDDGENTKVEEVENEEQNKQLDEAAIQMAYMSKLAALYRDTDTLADKLDSKVSALPALSSSGAGAQGLYEVIKDRGSLDVLLTSDVNISTANGEENGGFGNGQNNAVRVDVVNILQNKLQNTKKRQLENRMIDEEIINKGGKGKNQSKEEKESDSTHEGDDSDSDDDSDEEEEESIAYDPLGYMNF